ncbi:SusD/RagB family nutrient-binding outer membrane lipoprotein [Proteiniphilum acetatigenes]|uniref:SusD/RagB family nutrient-binding outer membrane lipoprotein n=1 Tax=Proteiniphilum acetatigenes TaxID=294710 RepID=UPI001FDF333D|nr:SusD/RagB family nutrient-binding outer membrane lipoprotein [Proteiniphilum acetatigenes]
MMSKIYKFLLLIALSFSIVSCEDLDTLNQDPNNPEEVPSHMLMNGAQKWIMDNVYDNWFSGRQNLVYAQYWAQRNYTEEDRYQIRESTNNNYFNYLYMGIANLEKVEKLNSDETTASENAKYGANVNQIAAAKILKVWLMNVITDTWGNVPYTEIAGLEDGVLYAKYDDQSDIYAGMLDELREAVNMIDESQVAFVSGDVIYGGDASKWKKFGNSLKCRLAIHLSKVDPNWHTYIEEAVADGVFTDNSDAATFKYSTTGSDYCLFYSGFFVDGRNDFTITKPFVDLLQGTKDDLNSKSHPWEGVVDPRLEMYTTAIDGVYRGIPYGIPNARTAALRVGTPNWYNDPPMFLEKDFAVPLMTYAELKFILSEYNGYSVSDYREGVEASITYWASQAGVTVSGAALNTYVDAVSQSVDAEAVAVQKYIDLFMNGTEAWTEIRRTGYPEQVLRPGEISAVVDGTQIPFTPLSDVKGDIIARVKYPTNESTLNGANWEEAVSKLDDGTNNYYTKMYWDVRTSTYDHPANQ